MEFEILRQQFIATGIIEWLAFGLGIAQVVLAWQNQRANFYVGLLSVSLYTYVFAYSGLYAESALNAYYAIISVWGILQWQQKKNESPKPITYCSKIEIRQSLLGGTLAIIILYGILHQFTNSNVPFLDALVSGLAWVGAYLLVQRKIENWLWLTASNLLAIPLQLYKGMPLTATLTIIYLVLGLLGYHRWKHESQRQTN
ncbi:MAG: nicotinamide riboside transporter PnuC [Chitinophagaceae bacterium]